MKYFKPIIILSLVVVLFIPTTSFGLGPSPGDVINQVIYTDIETFINAEKIDSFNINNKTAIYVSDLKKIDSLKVLWDGKKRHVTINSSIDDTNNTTSEPTKASTVIHRTADNPSMEQATFDLNPITTVHGVVLNNNQTYTSVDYTVDNNQLILKDSLPVNTELSLEIYGDNYQQLHYSISPLSLPSLTEFNQASEGGAEYLLIPPQPDEGFNFAMILLKRSGGAKYTPKQKHLFIDTLNIGHTKTHDFYKTLDIDNAIGHSHTAYSTAFDLGMPMVLALIPRSSADYYANITGQSSVYESALDRDTIFYKELISGDLYGTNIGDSIQGQLSAMGYEPKDFYNLDEQVLAMADFAKEYFNDNGMDLEDKYFMAGFSASGTFSDRLSTLHPTKFRAVFSGAAADDFVLPRSTESGENLILPLGVYDYQQATNREFNINDYNQVARIIHMGKDDDNDVFPYSDCYGDEERRIAYKLWRQKPLDRAYDLIDSFSASEGQGIFILDNGQKHGLSSAMEDYMLDFFYQNTGDNTPVTYPEIKNTTLEYYLFD